MTTDASHTSHPSHTSPETMSPDAVAREILALARPTLIVFDCDGVLAPLTDHADDSVLLDGVGQMLVELARIDDVTVAILSGRSLAGLDQFGFHDSIVVAGSYGGERRGLPGPRLDEVEKSLLAELDEIVTDAARAAGPGAWVERKPSSVVVHVREADPERGTAALEAALERQATLVGHEFHEGSNVLELMARPTDKGRGLDALRAEHSARAVVYLGDDVPDEDAFSRLGPGDMAVKVGPGPSIASHRLAGPEAVCEMLAALTV